MRRHQRGRGRRDRLGRHRSRPAGQLSESTAGRASSVARARALYHAYLANPALARWLRRVHAPGLSGWQSQDFDLCRSCARRLATPAAVRTCPFSMHAPAPNPSTHCPVLCVSTAHVDYASHGGRRRTTRRTARRPSTIDCLNGRIDWRHRPRAWSAPQTRVPWAMRLPSHSPLTPACASMRGGLLRRRRQERYARRSIRLVWSWVLRGVKGDGGC